MYEQALSRMLFFVKHVNPWGSICKLPQREEETRNEFAPC